ncbi:hypothetical protein Tco_0070912, partial [Tanacetum coccineum]
LAYSDEYGGYSDDDEINGGSGGDGGFGIDVVDTRYGWPLEYSGAVGLNCEIDDGDEIGEHGEFELQMVCIRNYTR